jgi:Family of unknown function (DUF6288)
VDDTRNRPIGVPRRAIAVGLALASFAIGPIRPALAQPETAQVGELVPHDVREIYDRGLHFLANSQTENGTWNGGEMRAGMTAGMDTAHAMDPTWANSGEQGPGVTALGLLALLASGEDPNFGLYSGHVRKALRSIIRAQDANTGYFGISMYHHGFAMLALAESYGAVDEHNLWPDGKAPRSVGQALELAVRAAVTAQKVNPNNAWRYGPNARDADASISGAVVVGLLAARNAGIEVPDDSIDKAIIYYRSMTFRTGDVFYVGQAAPADSNARSAIANLAFALARRKNLPEYRVTLKYLVERIGEPAGAFLEYTYYYEAQALFQGDIASWERWNAILVRQLKDSQQPDGSIRGRFGPTTSTALSLLSLALNYRFLPIYER